jgi:hypothetical protein
LSATQIRGKFQAALYNRSMIFLRTPLLELAGIQATAAGFP